MLSLRNNTNSNGSNVSVPSYETLPFNSASTSPVYANFELELSNTSAADPIGFPPRTNPYEFETSPACGTYELETNPRCDTYELETDPHSNDYELETDTHSNVYELESTTLQSNEYEFEATPGNDRARFMEECATTQNGNVDQNDATHSVFPARSSSQGVESTTREPPVNVHPSRFYPAKFKRSNTSYESVD